MYRLQSFLEKIQNQAVAQGKIYHVTFAGNQVIANDEILQLPSNIGCEGPVIYYYPQYTSAPAGTIRCKQEGERSLVIQLGRGRIDIR